MMNELAMIVDAVALCLMENVGVAQRADTFVHISRNLERPPLKRVGAL